MSIPEFATASNRGSLGVTVVIPTLGRDTLEAAVESASSQSWLPQALVLVANGATRLAEDRQIVLKRLADPVPLQVLDLPPFSGPSICRNVGAWAARSKYVAFLDDDDEFAAGYLEAMREAISSKGPDLAYATIVRLDAEGSVRSEGRLDLVPRQLWFESLYRQQNHGFGGTNLVIRREALFDLGGFRVDLLSGEDRALAMAAIRAGLTIVDVAGAIVVGHDAEGVRASERSDKWMANLKLVSEYWSDVAWRGRVLSLYRVIRSFASQRKKRVTTDTGLNASE